MLPNRTIEFGTAELRKYASLAVLATDNGASGAALVGADVTVTAPAVSATINANGVAGVGELRATVYSAQITSPIPAAGTTIQLVPGGVTVTTDATGVATSPITLTSRGAYIANVRTSADAPVTSGTLTLRPVIAPGVTADGSGPIAAGRAEFPARPSGLAYTVTVAKAHYFAEPTQSTTPQPGQAVTLGFALDQFNTVAGTIVDNTDTAVDDVTIAISPSAGVVQADNGAYSITDLPGGSFTITANKTGYLGDQEIVTLTANQDLTGIDFVLIPLVDPEVTVSGYPIGAGPPSPQDLANVTFTPTGTTPGTAVSDLTNATGVAEFPLIPRGTYTLTITKTGFNSFTEDVTLGTVSIPSPPQAVPLARTLERPKSIAGRLTSTGTGAPGVNGATISATRNGTSIGTATTAGTGIDAGTYTFTGLRSGDYVITVTAVPVGFELSTVAPVSISFTMAPATIGAVDQNFTVQPTPPPPPVAPAAPEGGEVDGFVTSMSGDGLDGVTVSAESLGGEVVTTQTDSDGSFGLDELAPSAWEITYSAPGYSPLTVFEEVRSGVTTTTGVVLSARGNAVSGHVSGRNANDATGTMLDGATVTLLDGGGSEVGRQTVSSGQYTFSHLEDGTYTLVFAHDGYESAQQTIELAGRDRAVVDGSLVARNGRLTVAVRSDGGDPVGGVEVRITSAQLAGGRSAVTSPDGTAVFDSLPPANDYAVDVGGGRATAGPVSVGAGQLDASVTVSLAEPGSISGVLTIDGAPTNGIELALYAGDEDTPLQSTFSGGDGRGGGFRFDNLAPGTTYRVVVFGEGAGRTERTTTVVAGETVALDITITTPAAATTTTVPATTSTSTSTTVPG